MTVIRVNSPLRTREAVTVIGVLVVVPMFDTTATPEALALVAFHDRQESIVRLPPS